MKNLLASLHASRIYFLALLAASTPVLLAQSLPVVDQSQTQVNLWQSIYLGNDAQSFVPRHDRLTRIDVELMVGSGALDFLELTVFADDGTGQPDVANPLASVNPRPGPETAVNGDLTTGWFVAELDSLQVQPGQTYYLRLNLPASSPDLRANWAAADGTLDPAFDNPYPDGSWWMGVGSLTPPVQFPHRDGTFKTYYPQELGPRELLGALADSLRSMGLNRGLENSLMAKLNAATDSFDRTNLKACLNQLNSFAQEVGAQTGKKLTPAQSSQLLGQLEQIVILLQ